MKEEERLKKEKQDMLGFYDYTVVLTYISLVISVFGMTRALAGDFKVAILCLYCVASVIRLGYFNVMEEKRQNETSELRQYYQGLPITSMAIILPFIYLLRKGCGANFLLVIHVAVVVVGVLFISDIKVKKPQNPMVILLVALVALALSMMFHLL